MIPGRTVFHPLPRALIALACTAYFCAAASSGNIKGSWPADEESSARVSVKATDAFTKFDSAASAPCSLALKMYEEIAGDTSASDTIRAGALGRLGDYHFAIARYGRARDYYRSASRLSSLSRFRNLEALSAALGGENEAAQSLWHTLSLDHQMHTAQMAQFHIGLTLLKQGSYKDAYAAFLASGPYLSQGPWSVPALAGKLACAKALGLRDKVIQYQHQIERLKGTVLESDYIKGIIAAPEVPDISENDAPEAVSEEGNAPPVSAKSSGPSGKLYTLQVGAFGSEESARKLQKNLSRSYSEVSISPATAASAQTLYRVRIGSFATQDEAQAFAKSKLLKGNISYRIVEK